MLNATKKNLAAYNAAGLVVSAMDTTTILHLPRRCRSSLHMLCHTKQLQRYTSWHLGSLAT